MEMAFVDSEIAVEGSQRAVSPASIFRICLSSII